MSDAAALGLALGYHVLGAPHDIRWRQDNQPDTQGIAILAKTTPQTSGVFYYHLAGHVLPKREEGTWPVCYPHHSHHFGHHAFLWADIPVDHGRVMRLGTLHHTVTPDGTANENQAKQTERLLAELAGLGPTVIAGDCNIPSGYNTNYDHFVSAGYRDAIPGHYTCSLDPLHRAWEAVPHIQNYMVDYVWLPEGHQAEDVLLVSGISDHQAIVAKLALE